MVALAPAVGGRVVVDQVGLHPDDRLDPGLLARLVVVDSTVHGAVIGEAEGRHAELRGPFRHGIDGALRGLLLDLAVAVEQRILAVDVQMYDGSAQDVHLASETRCQLAAFAEFALAMSHEIDELSLSDGDLLRGRRLHAERLAHPRLELDRVPRHLG